MATSAIPDVITLAELNSLATPAAVEFFVQVCHCQRWAEDMVNSRPFASVHDIQELAQQFWATATETEILEAFSGHARIGDLDALQKKFSAAATEQGQVGEASAEVIQDLFDENNQYFANNGFIFIVCATGKSANEMLSLLRSRSTNSRDQELINGAAEQKKITELRLAQRVN